jgi:hypothetical protein
MSIKYLIIFCIFSSLVVLVNSDIGDKVNDKITEQYTPTTYTSCKNNVCSLAIYSGIQYVNVNGTWKDITTVKSLKGILNLTIEEDPEFPVEILDYNLTDIQIKFKILDKYKGQIIPIKFIDENTKEVLISTNLRSSVDIINSYKFSDVNKSLLNFYMKNLLLFP